MTPARYDYKGSDAATFVCKKPAKKPNDLFVTTAAAMRRMDLADALPVEAPATLRPQENNRTLGVPLARGSRPRTPSALASPLDHAASLPLARARSS